MITLLGDRKTRKDDTQLFMGIRNIDKRVKLDPTLLALADHTSVVVPGSPHSKTST